MGWSPVAVAVSVMPPVLIVGVVGVIESVGVTQGATVTVAAALSTLPHVLLARTQ
jgi:hypothetical protein